MPTVLIVNDSATQRAIIRAYLEPLGYTVQDARDGAEALDIVSTTRPHLILMDIEMPGLSGFDTCKAIRGFLQEDWIPIIYLSAHQQDKNLLEGFASGGDAYLTKPVQPAVLQAIVRAMLRIVTVQEELISTNKRLEEMAHYDVLTKVMNRRGFDNMFERMWKHHRRLNEPMTLAIIDVDYFKKFNDAYGHIEGDKCLRSIGEALNQTLMRPIDIAARYGGEEFALLLPGTAARDASVVINRLQEIIRNLHIPHRLSDVSDIITVSIGYAESSLCTNQEEFLSLVDKTLYTAKNNGRNQAICANILQ